MTINTDTDEVGQKMLDEYMNNNRTGTFTVGEAPYNPKTATDGPQPVTLEFDEAD